MSKKKRDLAGTGTHTVKIQLDQEEQAAVAVDFAATHSQIEELKGDRRDINARLQDKRGHLAQLAEQMDAGHREETVNVRFEWVNGSNVAIVREDTDEEIGTRAPTADETQLKLVK